MTQDYTTPQGALRLRANFLKNCTPEHARSHDGDIMNRAADYIDQLERERSARGAVEEATEGLSDAVHRVSLATAQTDAAHWEKQAREAISKNEALRTALRVALQDARVLRVDLIASQTSASAMQEQRDLALGHANGLRAERDALRHDLERSMANHAADLKSANREDELARIEQAAVSRTLGQTMADHVARLEAFKAACEAVQPVYGPIYETVKSQILAEVYHVLQANGCNTPRGPAESKPIAPPPRYFVDDQASATWQRWHVRDRKRPSSKLPGDYESAANSGSRYRALKICDFLNQTEM